jgi:Mg-chelatase subunit ChlD
LWWLLLISVNDLFISPAMFADEGTSLITILSSEHGRMRRAQRDISKRDLQEALKHGEVSNAWGGRCRVEYNGIIFITDSTQRREITAFPAPHDMAPYDYDEMVEREKLKSVMAEKPELFKSHTVLVVDCSGSMMTKDIALFRDRQQAAYSTIAVEFVAEQLFNGTANNSDVVSLIEFNSDATVVFEREPFSWFLYNQILSRRDTRKFEDRERHRIRDTCVPLSGDSNYIPALKQAVKLLKEDFHDKCALSLMFLSDGAPTDAQANGLTPLATQRLICARMESIASKFGGRLTVQTIGFGNQCHDFSVLQQMVDACKRSSPETKAEFVYCDKISHAIGTAVSSFVTSLTETRTSLMHGRASKYTKRVVPGEEGGKRNLKDWDCFEIILHYAGYDPKRKQFLRSSSLPPGARRRENREEFNRRVRSPPPLLAISRKHCGTGAERFAFRCSLADRLLNSRARLVLGPMVAKETNSVERVEENIEFHKYFLQTQSLAAHLANEFNKRLRALPSFNESTTPRLEFLQCSVLELKDSAYPGGKRHILLEKMLDTERYPWRKWNDNAGTVNGRVAHVPIDVDYEMARLKSGLEMARVDGVAHLLAIAEGNSDEADEDDEEEDDEDSDEDDEEEDDDEKDNEDYEEEEEEGDTDSEEYSTSSRSSNDTNPSDYLQAFTHFTYLFTNKKVMVCDLQGVYNCDMVPPTFELTDPAIHYRSSVGRVMVFGRTDKGVGGMRLFFHTHKCSEICKWMRLTGKNCKWRKQWHQGAKFPSVG